MAVVTLIFAGVSAAGVILQLLITYVQGIGHISIQSFQPSTGVYHNSFSFYIRNMGSKTVLLTDMAFYYRGKHLSLKEMTIYNTFIKPSRLDEGGSLLLGYEIPFDQKIDTIVLTSTGKLNGIHHKKSFSVAFDLDNN